MTHTEAADMILRATSGEAYLVVLRAKTHAAILAAVVTIMDAARADALRDAADICGSLAETTYDDADGFEAALGCEAAIRALAQSHREPKP